MSDLLHVPAQPDPVATIKAYLPRLYPLLRSITGEGVRETHRILAELMPLDTMEIPTGTQVFDWTIPREWVVREAYLTGPDGRRVVDIRDHNLHLVNYSAPFMGTVDRAELDTHLYSLPDRPDAIPYVTSYYRERWGFCLPHRLREALPEGQYRVHIDTAFVDGALTLSECVLPGETDEEILLSTYTCHPQMANHELSGPLTAALLWQRLAAMPRRRHTYRFVFLPETIGAIAYLARRGEHLKQHCKAGYVLTCLGLDGSFTYKRTKQGDLLADRAAEYALARRPQGCQVIEFDPLGSDERQYGSLGFGLPVGSVMRRKYLEFPEYHTSLDDLDFVSAQAIWDSVLGLEKVLSTLECCRTFEATVKHGEPNLGSRGLYPTVGGTVEQRNRAGGLLWLMHFCDGRTNLLDIAERSGMDVDFLHELAVACLEKGVLIER